MKIKWKKTSYYGWIKQKSDGNEKREKKCNTKWISCSSTPKQMLPSYAQIIERNWARSSFSNECVWNVWFCLRVSTVQFLLNSKLHLLPHGACKMRNEMYNKNTHTHTHLNRIVVTIFFLNIKWKMNLITLRNIVLELERTHNIIFIHHIDTADEIRNVFLEFN